MLQLKATIGVEVINDNDREILGFYSNMFNEGLDGFGDIVFGGKPSPSFWVAEIVGFHKKWKYERKFLKHKKDYSKSNSKGSRGIYAWYILESGRVYEIKEMTSTRSSYRYFGKVTSSGEVEEISEKEVAECLKNQSE